MSPRNIGVVFGPTLFKSADPLQGLADISNFNAIVEKLVEHFELLFSHDMPDALQEASATAAGYEDTSRGTAVALYDYDGAAEGDDYYLPLIEGEVLESVRVGRGEGKRRVCREDKRDGRGGLRELPSEHSPSTPFLSTPLFACPLFTVTRWSKRKMKTGFMATVPGGRNGDTFPATTLSLTRAHEKGESARRCFSGSAT
jgi:hypothetical protein